MSSTGAGYDLSTTTYSPDGRVFQVEYAHKAVEKSGTCLGLRCQDGVVLAVEKPILSKMLVQGSNRRIASIDTHCGLAISGLSADGRQLVNKGREEAESFRGFYGHKISGKVLCDRLASHVHNHTLYWYLRPFGCSALLGTYCDDGPQLYNIEPSGVAYRYFATAIGKNSRGAASELEKIKFDTITCKEGVELLATIMYKLHDDTKDKDIELEISWVSDETDRKHKLIPQEILEEAVKKAIEAKERDEMDSESDSDA